MQFDPIDGAIDESTHSAFAALTGDRNPLHVDPLVARRLQFGERAVHGIHLVMKALSTLGSSVDLHDRRCARIRTRFAHPVPVNGDLRAVVDVVADQEFVVQVFHDAWLAADVRVWTETGAPTPVPTLHDTWTEHRSPIDQTHRPIEGSTGSVPFVSLETPGAFGDIVPDLLTLTRLVGMEMPGLHSLFSQFDLERLDNPSHDDGLQYTVASFDERFGKVGLHVTGHHLGGEATAFVRPAPTAQRPPTSWTSTPNPDEFAGQHALVVGGSRGLGEVIAQLLAVGGAEVTVTYRRGVEDARRVLDGLPGARHRMLELDVRDPEHLAGLPTATPSVTHLYFLATPPIFRGVNGVYSKTLFDDFRSVYVDAFGAVVASLGAHRLRGILVPSSEAVTQPVAGLAEYADAKRLAEAAAHRLSARHPTLTVACPRLPRLATDQTASLLPTERGDAVGELLPALRSIADSSAT